MSKNIRELQNLIGKEYYQTVELALFTILNTKTAKKHKLKSYEDLKDLRILDYIKLVKEERSRIQSLDLSDSDKDEMMIKVEQAQQAMKTLFKYDGSEVFFANTAINNRHIFELYMMKRVNTLLYIKKMAKMHFEFLDEYNIQYQELQEDLKDRKLSSVAELVISKLPEEISMLDIEYNAKEKAKELYEIDTLKTILRSPFTATTNIRYAAEQENISFIENVINKQSPYMYGWKNNINSEYNLDKNYGNPDKILELDSRNAEFTLNSEISIIPSNFYKNSDEAREDNKISLIVANLHGKPRSVQFGGNYVNRLDVIVK